MPEDWTLKKGDGNEKDAAEIFTVTEKMPVFPGGMSAMMKYLQENLTYPSYESKQSLGGKFFIKFVVDVTGQLRHVEVIRGSGFQELDREAMRVVKAMPAWEPGTQDGKKVPV